MNHVSTRARISAKQPVSYLHTDINATHELMQTHNRHAYRLETCIDKAMPRRQSCVSIRLPIACDYKAAALSSDGSCSKHIAGKARATKTSGWWRFAQRTRQAGIVKTLDGPIRACVVRKTTVIHSLIHSYKCVVPLPFDAAGVGAWIVGLVDTWTASASRWTTSVNGWAAEDFRRTLCATDTCLLKQKLLAVLQVTMTNATRYSSTTFIALV